MRSVLMTVHVCIDLDRLSTDSCTHSHTCLLGKWQVPRHCYISEFFPCFRYVYSQSRSGGGGGGGKSPGAGSQPSSLRKLWNRATGSDQAQVCGFRFALFEVFFTFVQSL